MPETAHGYSDAALRAARRAYVSGGCDRTLDAAHDRSVLGLDASVRAASYRAELLREIADSFRPGPVDMEAEDMALFAMETRARIQREVIEEVAAKLEGADPRSGDWFARWIRQEYADA